MNNATESIERLLQLAAGFEPEKACPPDIVDRALRRTRPRGRNTVVWSAALATGCAALWMVLHPSTLSVRQIAPAQTARGKAGDSRVALLPNEVPGKRLNQHTGSTMADKQPTLSQKQTTSRKSKLAPPAKRVAGRNRRSAHRKRGHESGRRMFASLPKAIWREERVQSYQAGVLAPALLVRRDEDNQIHVQPAIIQVPLAGGQAIARIAPANLEEERP